jgi:hypothetical protein
MSINHHRAIGVKDKDHDVHFETSLYDREGTSKKYKPDGATIPHSSRGSYSGMESNMLRGPFTLTPFFMNNPDSL